MLYEWLKTTVLVFIAAKFESVVIILSTVHTSFRISNPFLEAPNELLKNEFDDRDVRLRQVNTAGCLIHFCIILISVFSFMHSSLFHFCSLFMFYCFFSSRTLFIPLFSSSLLFV